METYIIELSADDICIMKDAIEKHKNNILSNILGQSLLENKARKLIHGKIEPVIDKLTNAVKS